MALLRQKGIFKTFRFFKAFLYHLNLRLEIIRNGPDVSKYINKVSYTIHSDIRLDLYLYLSEFYKQRPFYVYLRLIMNLKILSTWAVFNYLISHLYIAKTQMILKQITTIYISYIFTLKCILF